MAMTEAQGWAWVAFASEFGCGVIVVLFARAAIIQANALKVQEAINKGMDDRIRNILERDAERRKRMAPSAPMGTRTTVTAPSPDPEIAGLYASLTPVGPQPDGDELEVHAS